MMAVAAFLCTFDILTIQMPDKFTALCTLLKMSVPRMC